MLTEAPQRGAEAKKYNEQIAHAKNSEKQMMRGRAVHKSMKINVEEEQPHRHTCTRTHIKDEWVRQDEKLF
jgi:hypothetical protein